MHKNSSDQVLPLLLDKNANLHKYPLYMLTKTSAWNGPEYENGVLEDGIKCEYVRLEGLT